MEYSNPASPSTQNWRLRGREQDGIYHPNPAEVEQIQTRLLDTLPRNPPRNYSQTYP